MAEKQLPPKLFNLDATIGLQSTSFISLNRQRDEHQGGGELVPFVREPKGRAGKEVFSGGPFGKLA